MLLCSSRNQKMIHALWLDKATLPLLLVLGCQRFLSALKEAVYRCPISCETTKVSVDYPTLSSSWNTYNLRSLVTKTRREKPNCKHGTNR
jgi:hypothetical protein